MNAKITEAHVTEMSHSWAPHPVEISPLLALFHRRYHPPTTHSLIDVSV
jgi:hypothetical protein